MMKTTILIFLFLTNLLFVSCQKQTEPTEGAAPVAARLSSVITRAIGNSWSANDQIGVFMTSSDNVSAGTILNDANNIAYTVASAGVNGSFSPSSPNETILLPQDESKVTFVAYYPYGSLTDYALSINLADQSNQEALDIMSATTANISKNAPNVVLNFSRAMSKVIIQTSSPIYTAEQMAAMTVKITALHTRGRFELSNRELSSIETPVGTTAKAATPGSVYEATLFPEPVAAQEAKIEFSIANKTLVYIIPTVSFIKGERYTYTLELGRVGVNNLNSTITDWVDDPKENNGTAE